jgi:hypothetical protein
LTTCSRFFTTRGRILSANQPLLIRVPQHPPELTSLTSAGLTITSRIVVSDDFRQFAGTFSKVDATTNTLREASKGKAIVFDLRSHRSEVDESSALWFTAQFTEALPTILDADIVKSASRSRMYSGYPSEEGGFEGYFSASVVQDGPTLRGTAAKGSARPMAFLIDSGSPDLSALLDGLQASGQAIVVLQGQPANEVGLDVYIMDLPEGVKVAIRVDELMNPDGSIGLRPATPVSRESYAPQHSVPAATSATKYLMLFKSYGPPAPEPKYSPCFLKTFSCNLSPVRQY